MKDKINSSENRSESSSKGDKQTYTTLADYTKEVNPSIKQSPTPSEEREKEPSEHTADFDENNLVSVNMT